MLYGIIRFSYFSGGPHSSKAQYLRLNFDTNPADIMSLFENVWEMPPPKLIITIHVLQFIMIFITYVFVVMMMSLHC